MTGGPLKRLREMDWPDVIGKTLGGIAADLFWLWLAMILIGIEHGQRASVPAISFWETFYAASAVACIRFTNSRARSKK